MITHKFNIMTVIKKLYIDHNNNIAYAPNKCAEYFVNK